MPTDFFREPNFIVMTLLVFFSTCDTDNICPISNPPPSQHRCTRELQSPQLPQDSPEQQVLAIAGRPWNGNGWSWIGNGLKTIYYDLDARHRVKAGAVIVMDVNKPHLDASEKDAVGLRKSTQLKNQLQSLYLPKERQGENYKWWIEFCHLLILIATNAAVLNVFVVMSHAIERQIRTSENSEQNFLFNL